MLANPSCSFEEVRQCFLAFRKELKNIVLGPTSDRVCVRLCDVISETSNDTDVVQAMADLKREMLFVNGREVVGRVLASRRELVKVLREAIEQGTVRVRDERKGAECGYSSGSMSEASEGKRHVQRERVALNAGLERCTEPERALKCRTRIKQNAP